MARKIIIAISAVLGVGVILLLVLLNVDSFIATTYRLSQVLKIDNLKSFVEIYNESSTVIYDESISEIQTTVNSFIESIKIPEDKTFEDILADILTWLLNFSFDFVIYFCNYGLNIMLITYIMLNETFNGEQLRIKTSPFAFVWIRINNLLNLIKNGLKWAINKVLEFISTNRRIIAVCITLILLANGVLYRILVEFIIFIITYVIHMINLETYVVVFDIIKALFTFVYPNLKYIPTWIFWPILILIVFLSVISRAKYKLKKNHERLKDFAKNDLTQTTFINGPPGTGKTLLNVSLTLASEENFIEELNQKLLEYEMRFKYFNFAKVREHPEQYPEHAEYYELYDFIYNRNSFNISNFSIMSPAFDQRCKIWRYEYMRKNKQEHFPLEEYIVISLSEFDKEYNSHDDKKAVGEDGVHVFFSTVSHELKRHVKIFVDYQLKDQVPLRIRGNAEYFITIKKREKKMPTLLSLYYFPFKLLKKIIYFYIEKYEKKKTTINKRTTRKALPRYKRNDLTLPYVMLRDFGKTIKKICDWFESFSYFKLKVILSQEDDLKGIKKNLFINIRDLEFNGEPLYDTAFLSYAYETKCEHNFRNLQTYQGLQPTPEELALQESNFLTNAGFTNNPNDN